MYFAIVVINIRISQQMAKKNCVDIEQYKHKPFYRTQSSLWCVLNVTINVDSTSWWR